MKFNPIALITILLLFGISAKAQDERYRLQLQHGSFIPEKNINPEALARLDQKVLRTRGIALVVIQFDGMPSESARTTLAKAGVTLLDYLPAFAYTALVKGALTAEVLQKAGVRAVTTLSPTQKMQQALAEGRVPAYAVKVAGTMDCWFSYPSGFSFETIRQELDSRNILVVDSAYTFYHVAGIRIAPSRIAELAAQPFVEFIQAAPGEPQLLNNKVTVNARANVITSSLGRGLNGKGVVVGHGDNADLLQHPDFTNRIINRNPLVGGNHGQHTAGTLAGAGIMMEKFAGFAPKATILSQNTTGILRSMRSYYNDEGMVITNNSYGLIVDDCELFGTYDLNSRILDQQAADMPFLENVFAAGNSGLLGATNCTRYANGFGTVLGGYQSAKNVVCVGNTTENDSLHYVSSKGPVRDGRIKPDITAQGRIVWSAGFGSYWPNTGTSMSAPAVSGGLALLYQHYRNLYGGNPTNALMKALLCNGATDLGPEGPDYAYGFGWMNLLRSAIMLENHDYFTGAVANGTHDDQVINVPANTALLKVMLYWNDTAASVLAAHTLVNDLDLEVIDPSSGVHLPYVLDTLPADILHAATTGVDHINNIEQVVLRNPAPGNYTFRVKGTAVNMNPTQQYVLVFDTIPVSTTLTYPIGDEHFYPGDSMYVSWDAWGGTPGTFSLEFNNGSGWAPIATVADTVRQYNFKIDSSVLTENAQIRITNNGTGATQTSSAFTILAANTISLSPLSEQCEGYIKVTWTKVPGATDYEPMILHGDEMVSAGITTDTNFVFSNLSRDTVYWVSVRPRLNGRPGRRATAIARQPNTGGCSGSISDNDIALDAILAPASSGRLLTSNVLSNNETLTVRLKNLDDVTSTGNILVNYSINGGPVVNETIVSPAIAAAGTLDYNFSSHPDLSMVGNYNLKIWIQHAGDLNPVNDTLEKLVRQLDNPAITLSSLPMLDDFEGIPEQTVRGNQMGLDGGDRYDFSTSTTTGRLRSFVNSGIAYSGNHALTLDADHYTGTNTVNSLVATYNLDFFNYVTDDIRLDFRYKNHGQLPDAANQVWIRGSDQDSWTPAYDLGANQPGADGSYKWVQGIKISQILQDAGQNFSTSFQVKWGQAGYFMTADNQTGAGYTFDDIRLYRVSNDLQMVRIDTPVASGCALNATVPVKVTIFNTSSNTVTGIPIVLKVDGTTYPAETIPSIGGNATIQYLFNATTADLSAPGNHTVTVWLDYTGDSYHENDTASVTVTNSPVVTTFPYLEDFETGTNGWYAQGTNSSWEYGTPASVRINGAASGSNAWKTSLAGYYHDNEVSYLYSPCFDISGMTNPTLSFSLALDLEDCGAGLCDAAWVEYSTDGSTWTKLGNYGQGTNWYNKNYGGTVALWSVSNYTNWHVATIALPSTNNSRIRLRFVMNADPELDREGIAVDDIHIYDNLYGIYTGATMGAPVNQVISAGTHNWIDFLSGGQLVASIQPNDQPMGSTDVQAYINTGAVRFYNNQYYHDRNITIKPATRNLADSANVRFYFLDSETEALLAASGCGSCSKPGNAYQLGVSKYSDPNTAVEDGDVANSSGWYWSFINAARARKVPFDKGYYAEFKVKNFSEFWLNNGGADNLHPLPVQLSGFTADKINNGQDGWLRWKTAGEWNVARFDVEMARSTMELAQNRFTVIGQVAAAGNSTTDQSYQFTDREPGKSGVRYYRLHIVDRDGSSSYSEIRPLVFSGSVQWDVYPNPSRGQFNIVFQLNTTETLQLRVLDASGRTVWSNSVAGSGFLQKQLIDLSGGVYASGLYLLEATSEGKSQTFRLLKQ